MGQMMNHTSHMTAAAKAEAMFSCANIALILDTILLVSIFVILANLISLIALLGIIAIRPTAPTPKDACRCFA